MKKLLSPVGFLLWDSERTLAITDLVLGLIILLEPCELSCWVCKLDVFLCETHFKSFKYESKSFALVLLIYLLSGRESGLLFFLSKGDFQFFFKLVEEIFTLDDLFEEPYLQTPILLETSFILVLFAKLFERSWMPESLKVPLLLSCNSFTPTMLFACLFIYQLLLVDFLLPNLVTLGGLGGGLPCLSAWFMRATLVLYSRQGGIRLNVSQHIVSFLRQHLSLVIFLHLYNKFVRLFKLKNYLSSQILVIF